MRAIAMLVAGMLLLAGAGQAQTVDEAKAELVRVEKQLRDAHLAKLGSEAVQTARKQAETAESALQKALAEVPEIRDLDTQIKTASEQLRALHEKRRAAEARHAAELALAKAVRDAAQQALRDQLLDPAEKALIERRRELLRTIAASEATGGAAPIKDPSK